MGIKMKRNLGLSGKILIGLIYAIPIWIAIVFSFHPNSDFTKLPLTIWTDNLTLENFQYVLENVPVFSYLKNSFIMIIICIPCQLILSSMAAYAFSLLEFPMKNTLFAIFLTTMMIPGEVTFVANFLTVQSLGLINTYLGMCITSLCGAGSIFMLRQNMMSMPKELWEASRIDGCSKFGYFVRVALPLSSSILSAMAINSFIGIYNAYLWPLMVTTRNEFHTIQIGMANLTASTANRYGYVLAGAALCMLIPMIAFLFGQDKIVEGMTAGAVKS